METWILFVFLVTGSKETGWEYESPRIISFHDSQLQCYKELGLYITDHAGEIMNDKSFMIRCIDDSDLDTR
jgi:hypothetical protein